VSGHRTGALLSGAARLLVIDGFSLREANAEGGKAAVEIDGGGLSSISASSRKAHACIVCELDHDRLESRLCFRRHVDAVLHDSDM
jgi:hypothetical protein